jgi:hypothetical protein
MPLYQSQDVAAIDFLVATEISLYQFLKAHPTTEDEETLDGLKFFHRQLSPIQVIEAVGNSLGKHLVQQANDYQQKQTGFDIEKSQTVVKFLVDLMTERKGKDSRQAINGFLGHMEANFDVSSIEPLEEDSEKVSTSPKIITPDSMG